MTQMPALYIGHGAPLLHSIICNPWRSNWGWCNSRDSHWRFLDGSF